MQNRFLAAPTALILFLAVLASGWAALFSPTFQVTRILIVLGFAAAWLLCFWALKSCASRWRLAGPLLGLAVLSLAVRVAWIVAVPNEQVTDFAVYDELATALSKGEGYTYTGPVGLNEDLNVLFPVHLKSLPYPSALRSPGTAIIGSLVYRVLGRRIFLIKILYAFLGMLSTLLIYLILREEGFQTAGLLAGALWALYPAAIFATSLFCSEIPFTAGLLLLVFLLLKASRRTSPTAFLLIGAVAGAVCYVRPNWIPILAGVGFVCWRRFGFRRGAMRYGLFVLAMLLAIAPWTVRNWRVLHRFVLLSTNEGIFAGLKSFSLVPPGVQHSEEWKSRYGKEISFENEADAAHYGYSFGTYNIKKFIFSGDPAFMARTLWMSVRYVFEDDREMLIWSTTNSLGVKKSSGPPRALSPEAFAFWARLNAAFYLLVLVLALAAVLSSIMGGFIMTGRSLEFIFVYLPICLALHMLYWGTPRFHFSWMPFFIMMAAAFLSRQSPSSTAG